MSKTTKKNLGAEGLLEEVIRETVYDAPRASGNKPIVQRKKTKKTVGERRSPSRKSSSISQMRYLGEDVDDSFAYFFGCEEFDGEESKVKIRAVLSRTSMLLQDYREFKAARVIQTACRGWYTRRMLAKRKRSAEIIQRVWRGFLARRVYYNKLEQTLQDRIVRHFNRQATKIQALWRGFWVRQNVHDQYRMTRLQERTAKDLLHCVAFKLHHLLRTYHIPGVYSLRNSNCFSKVEKLLASLSFKQHNEMVRIARTRRDNAIHIAKREHGETIYNTELPYSGPDFSGCEPKCCALYKEKDADSKMFKILSLYEREAARDARMKKIEKRQQAESKKQKGDKKVGKRRRKEKPSDFCGDIVSSMKRWKILGENNLTIRGDIFKKPENVEKFLTEIQSINSFLKAKDCFCHLKPNQKEKCSA